jgi:hypothetical protein
METKNKLRGLGGLCAPLRGVNVGAASALFWWLELTARDESIHLEEKGLLDPLSAYENVRFL